MTRLTGILLTLPILMCAPAVLPAQGSPAWAACRTDSLSTFNCASYYNGTVTMNATVKAAGVDQFTVITATVTAGKVSCRFKTEEIPEFTAPGMVAIEHGSNRDAGKYKVSVWCPDAPGKRVSRRDQPNIEVYEQEAADYARLQGEDSYDGGDEVNGVTEKVTTTWRLERK